MEKVVQGEKGEKKRKENEKKAVGVISILQMPQLMPSNNSSTL